VAFIVILKANSTVAYNKLHYDINPLNLIIALESNLLYYFVYYFVCSYITGYINVSFDIEMNLVESRSI